MVQHGITGQKSVGDCPTDLKTGALSHFDFVVWDSRNPRFIAISLGFVPLSHYYLKIQNSLF